MLVRIKNASVGIFCAVWATGVREVREEEVEKYKAGGSRDQELYVVFNY
jgi:hypothetical protein